MIKELTEELKENFFCLGENSEKYITFSVPIRKEIKIIGKRVKEIKPKPYPGN